MEINKDLKISDSNFKLGTYTGVKYINYAVFDFNNCEPGIYYLTGYANQNSVNGMSYKGNGYLINLFTDGNDTNSGQQFWFNYNSSTEAYRRSTYSKNLVRTTFLLSDWEASGYVFTPGTYNLCTEHLGGYITSGNSEILFTYIFEKPLRSDISNIVINSANFAIRPASGNAYIEGGAFNYDSSKYSITVAYMKGNVLTMRLKKLSGTWTNGTNNSPVGLALSSLNVTLS